MKEKNFNLVPKEYKNDKLESSEKQNGQHEVIHNSRGTGKIKKTIASLIIIIIILLAVFSSSVIFSDESMIKNLSAISLAQRIGQLIRSGDKKLVGEKNDRINVVIIGIGGQSHEAGTLADTIILSSLKPSTNRAAIMSLPRDLLIPTDRYGQVKINAIYAYAEANKEGDGGQAMVAALEKLLDTEIYYYVAVDFNGFEKIIDEFGGVDIEVERDLIDKRYPIRGKEFVYPVENRFETLHIKKGWQHMDGNMALKYARSRHGQGIEGSDFARSVRQQKILSALKEKILSFKTLLNPKRIKSLLSAYKNHIVTNLQIWEILRLVQFSHNINTDTIINQALTNDPDGMLYADNINDAYVLLPHNNDFTDIKNLWKYIFYKEAKQQNTNNTSASKTFNNVLPLPTDPIKPKITHQNESAKIEIKNGTWQNGYAGKEKTKLETKGFTIINTSNADHHEYKKTVIYDFSNGKYPETAKELIKIYNRPLATEIPLVLDSSADFVIILGEK